MAAAEAAARESSGDEEWLCETCYKRPVKFLLTPRKALKCSCGMPWHSDSLPLCDLKCPDLYWIVGEPRQARNGKRVVSVGVEDECGGCGNPLVFDVDFNVQTIEEVEAEEEEEEVEQEKA